MLLCVGPGTQGLSASVVLEARPLEAADDSLQLPPPRSRATAGKGNCKSILMTVRRLRATAAQIHPHHDRAAEERRLRRGDGHALRAPRRSAWLVCAPLPLHFERVPRSTSGEPRPKLVGRCSLVLTCPSRQASTATHVHASSFAVVFVFGFSRFLTIHTPRALYAPLQGPSAKADESCGQLPGGHAAPTRCVRSHGLLPPVQAHRPADARHTGAPCKHNTHTHTHVRGCVCRAS